MSPKSELDRLERQNPGFRLALEKCLDKIGRRDRLTAELREVLDESGTPRETAASVLEFLQDRGFIDDRKTVHQHIARRTGERGMGREKVKAELIGRGAPEDLVEECLRTQFSEETEIQAAQTALQRRFGSTVPKAKAGRFLLSKGFSEELVEQVLGRSDEFDRLPD